MTTLRRSPGGAMTGPPLRVQDLEAAVEEPEEVQGLPDLVLAATEPSRHVREGDRLPKGVHEGQEPPEDVLPGAGPQSLDDRALHKVSRLSL